MISVALLLLGLFLLLAGGALLVRGASEIAANAGISPLVIGLTVVGFGTSAPELVVNTIGAATGQTDLAFGNVVGSNISNLALVLGTVALIMPITIQSSLVRRELPLLLLGTTIMTVMALDTLLEGGLPAISRSDAVILLLLFGIFIYTNVLDLLQQKAEDPLFREVGDYPLLATQAAGRMPWLFVVTGVVLLFLGGKWTIDSAADIATGFGIPATVVGIYVLAIGTSMPELVTSIIAAVRKEPDLALGNVIGSNLFNALVVLPVSALVAPITIPAGGVGDLVMSWALAAFLVPVFFLGRAALGRVSGAALLLVYVAYAVWRTLYVTS